MDIFQILLAVLLTALYGVFGIGTMTLLRYQEKSFPKVLALVWFVVLIFAAIGAFDEPTFNDGVKWPRH